MKAWMVRERNGFNCVVAFAPTRGKAKSEALWFLDDVDFLHLEATRFPLADSKYNDSGESYCLDWLNPDDRLFLVNDCGLHCEEIWLGECKTCVAKEYCSLYQDELLCMVEDAL